MKFSNILLFIAISVPICAGEGHGKDPEEGVSKPEKELAARKEKLEAEEQKEEDKEETRNDETENAGEGKEDEQKVLDELTKKLGETDKEGKKGKGAKDGEQKADEVDLGDLIPEELLGPTTKGGCTQVHIPLPWGGDFKAMDFGDCFDYRNAVCVKSKCRCMAGQKLSEDEEYCVDPDVCTSHLSQVSCAGVFGFTGVTDVGKCPDWSGAKCDNNTWCECDSESKNPCATQVTGYWAWKDMLPKCGPRITDKKRPQTCQKYTEGTCLMSFIAHAAKDVVLKAVAAPLGKAGSVIKAVSKQGISAINASIFAEEGSCDHWRNTVCMLPVFPSPGGSFGNGMNAVDSAIYGKSKGANCLCRPTDCAVWSKKHKGMMCVYSAVLELDNKITKDFETLASGIYQDLSKALKGKGDDAHADFFEGKHHLIKKYADNFHCVRANHDVQDFRPECKAMLCEFARSAMGTFPLANAVCGSDESKLSMLPIGIAGLVTVAVSVMVIFRRRHAARKHEAPMFFPIDDEAPASFQIAPLIE